MSFVDLSPYDRPTTNAQTNRGVELIDNHNGERRTVLDTGEYSERLMIDFLSGRRKIDSIPQNTRSVQEVVRQDLIDLGLDVPKVKEQGNLLVRLVRELV